MTAEQLFLIAITSIPLALVLANKLRLDVAALAMASALGLAQLAGWGMFGPPHTPHNAVKAIAGFSQPVVLTLFSLFVLTSAIEKSGAARWMAAHIVAWGGHSERRLIVLFSTASALLSVFMNNLAASALILPSAIDASRRSGIKTSKLLIPVAYGSLLGGVATYFTTANIIVSDLLTTANPPQKPLHILDFTPTGGLIALAGILFLALAGPSLLPNRDARIEQSLVRRTAVQLAQQYQLPERLWELRVLPGDSMTVHSATQFGVAIAAVWRGAEAIFAPPDDAPLFPDDLLLAVGREERIHQIENVEIGRNHEGEQARGGLKGVMLVETMIAPQSRLVDQTLRQHEFRKNYGFTGVALLRGHRSYRTDVATQRLQPGDSLLMVGSPDRLPLLNKVNGLIVFDPDPGDLPIRRGTAIASAAILAAAVFASLAGVPVYLATLLGAVALFLTGLFPVEEAYAAMPWQALVLVAGMYSVSLAMVQTGLAGMISDSVVGWVAPYGQVGLAAGAYLLTALLTQIIGGQVAALVTGPVTIAAALRLHHSPEAVAVATAIGCSAAFLTPIAHPVNLLVIGPGNYQFRDFVKVGLPLTVVSFAALIAGLLLFWR
ncbi:MAG TPA: SLC13 family permease [Bryobacteraceae bacterium]|jgi:di/tricarboxylate transporter